ncbi:unnamed protein product [Rotaria magnacalcarata]|uniref:Uncharacterized protein n=3 Tax=Rotaria magnacalcarata TaxID=392030 RepID=A0A816VRI7_9BILA|nr:unnamed protein product [Rotaria magnacalcarata]CAF1611823.1 unnamed protein product [Rotaria magnacalcarata]CAF2051528.1 unnamed protein product [Rotaria magnacalcarata]CAF2113780.1 unnamed protein product [Rotaria magnacalcarata]CAF2124263.1 unnamed protein product [Rotaria magnacalcarata]
MSLANLIYQHMLVLSILFKHWFLGLINLFAGGPPLKDVSSDIVLITGAASGLGKGIAQRLARLGCTLVLWDVDHENNIRVAEELNNATNSKRVHAFKCDLTNKENIYACAKTVQETVGQVTMVINNAGVVSGKNFLECSDTSIQRTFDVNIMAHFWILKAFLPSMLENNHGHIVTIASGAGLVGASGLVDYCSSKFAAVGLHESLTHELYGLKKSGIKTTVVCPSFINTGMFDGVKTSEVAPLLQQDNVCDLIVEAIRKNQHKLLIPKLLNLSLVLNSMSTTDAQLEVQDMIGLHHSMDTFTGRHQKSS